MSHGGPSPVAAGLQVLIALVLLAITPRAALDLALPRRRAARRDHVGHRHARAALVDARARPIRVAAGAIALRSVASQIGVVAGPAVGGLIFAIEPLAVYALAAAMLIAAGAAMLGMPAMPSRRGAEQVDRDSLIAGIRFIRSTKVVLGAILLDLVAVFFGDPIALAPVFAKTILDGGPVVLGLLRAAPRSERSSLAFSSRAGRCSSRPDGRCSSSSRPSVPRRSFRPSRSLPLSLAMLAITGFVDMFSMNIRSTTVTMLTPIELQGRVSAVEWVFISGSNELGAFESGVMASLLGATRAVVLGGALMIGFAASWPRFFPALARLGRLEELEPEPT